MRGSGMEKPNQFLTQGEDMVARSASVVPTTHVDTGLVDMLDVRDGQDVLTPARARLDDPQIWLPDMALINFSPSLEEPPTRTLVDDRPSEEQTYLGFHSSLHENMPVPSHRLGQQGQYPINANSIATSSPVSRPSRESSASCNNLTFEGPSQGTPESSGAQQQHPHSQQEASASAASVDWSLEYSLDSRPGYSHQLIGNSCESDPYLLRNYGYDQLDTYRMFRLDFRKIKDDERLQPFLKHSKAKEPCIPAGKQPIQFVMTSEDIWKDSLKFVEKVQSGGPTEADDLALLDRLVAMNLRTRLIKLYVRHVHPRFPVLSLSDFSTMPFHELSTARPIGIQAAVCALALPFSFLDDELSILKGYDQSSADDLWAIAYRSYQRATCFSHLSSLQLCLLLLQAPPPNFAVAEPLSTWALTCSALSIAENMGLNHDPSDWRLPREEVILRRRLWWFTYMQHVWHAIVVARPSHIHEDNWDVGGLVASDFEVDGISDPEIRSRVERNVPMCIAQCELSIIASDVLNEFYTLRAVRKNSDLGALLSRAQPLRSRIETWRQSLPLLSKRIYELEESEFDDGGALRLSHLTLEALILRALMRPLFYQAIRTDYTLREPISLIFENSYACAKVVVEMIAAFKAKHFSGFWHPHARYQLCYFSSLILMTITQSPTIEIARRSKALLDQWRDTLRTQSRAWPLARLATIRLDAALWKGLSFITRGSGENSPASSLLKQLEAENGSSPPVIRSSNSDRDYIQAV
ncbi:uncharacterized protein PV09_05343 [Verruconis gallopava]|uniref:Xylanolytic transcriptional activator regulatory domain-containing protein n=1 Tax=Verruconis gallopava TaxID=253628 RepID=A0A0D2AWR0_9PEZI|nr:uncharacterized protein PV09_05343 [Verruconis gallopava]KIW03589.1 hypothetical protein PV09_05343 [Verruconis gallopava]